MSNDLAPLARELKLPIEQVAKTVELLVSGNTIPFITRFRKDQTGGLNEKQILAIQTSHSKRKAITERRAFILKSIDSQGKLTDELKAAIEKTESLRQMEDLYLPFKTKKQSLAFTAKQQGLQPLAEEVLGATSMIDLAARAPEFVRVDKGLSSVDDVIAGVGHILAEKFSEDSELRAELRRVLWETGKLDSKEIPPKTPAVETPPESNPEPQKPELAPPTPTPPAATETANNTESVDSTNKTESAESTTGENQIAATADTESTDAASVDTDSGEDTPTVVDSGKPTATTTTEGADAVTTPDSETEKTKEDSASDENKANATVAMPAANVSSDSTEPSSEKPAAEKPKAKAKKKKKKKKVDSPFKDYFDFQQPIKQVLYHQTLATNRGERSGALKVKIVGDDEKISSTATAKLVPVDHPCKDFLAGCVEDSLNRLILPSLEREIRREITESAESHAVSVFAKNLKNLLLQRPTTGKRILAIDPGYKSGCTVAVLNIAGEMIATDKLFVVGNAQRKSESATKLADLIKQHSADVIAIGNGTASRETELLVAGVLNEHFADADVRYTIINEAGTAAYSTSEIGREELPDLSPNVRSAVSIGRRLIDPLSELVKISPANIGVGMYQHDVKAKHLSESLDNVVESCVNQVGVNVNTASPSLLRYVSGLNQLTARRIFEYRQEKGPFKNREQLKRVTGFGDATFVQSAGFLRVQDGEQPLDSTSIHPESYDLAHKILERVNAKPSELIYSLPNQEIKPTPEPAVQPTPEPAVQPTTEPAVQSTPEPVAAPTPESAPQAESTPTATTGEESKTVSEAISTPGEAPTEPDATPPPAAESKVETEAHSTESAQTDSAEPSVTTAATTQEPKPAPESPSQIDKEKKNRRREIVDQLRKLEAAALATEFNVGSYLVTDIFRNLTRSKHDPRDGINKPIFRKALVKAEDLKPDMQIEGKIVNVVDFGVFVDIGLGESCLVHVSQLSHGFIRNTHDVFNVGDNIRVWVSEFDTDRRRLKLTAIRPGSSKPQRPHKRRTGAKPAPRADGKPAHARKTTHTGRYAGRKGKSDYKRTERPTRRPPKPAKPITKDMLEGKEPMRSFSDLLQFVEKKPDKKKDDSNDS